MATKKVKKTKEPSGGMESSNTQIIPHPGNEIQNFNIETLIARGIDKRLSVDSMERLLAMRTQLKAEWAKEQFTRALAAFQADCPTIVKTKEVKTNSGQVAYKYAPLESIVEQVKSILQKHGFSYSTNMEVLPTGVKVKLKVTHIDGHEEISEMEVPLGTKTAIMSASQQTAAASTFAKRYAFCNAFGILTGDEDNDGANLPAGTKDDINDIVPGKPPVNQVPPPAKTPTTAARAAEIMGGQVVTGEVVPPKPAEQGELGARYKTLASMISSAKNMDELNGIPKVIESMRKGLTEVDMTNLRKEFSAKKLKLEGVKA